MSKTMLPSITTGWNPDWQQQIKEVKDLNLSRVALFLTGLGSKERSDCYKLLKELSGLEIPFVHARNDMTPEEFQFLIDQFKTQKFNLHATRIFPPLYNISQYYSRIYIENNNTLTDDDLKGFAGICLDISHLENLRLQSDENYEKIYQLAAKYPVGANHLSAITKTSEIHPEDSSMGFDNHHLKSYSQFNYLLNYPHEFFGSLVSIELTNSIKEQLGLIAYIKDQLLKEQDLN